jgi:hypothetical protein
MSFFRPIFPLMLFLFSFSIFAMQEGSQQKTAKIAYKNACKFCVKRHVKCDDKKPCRRCIKNKKKCVIPPKKLRKSSKRKTEISYIIHNKTPKMNLPAVYDFIEPNAEDSPAILIGNFIEPNVEDGYLKVTQLTPSLPSFSLENFEESLMPLSIEQHPMEEPDTCLSPSLPQIDKSESTQISHGSVDQQLDSDNDYYDRVYEKYIDNNWIP